MVKKSDISDFTKAAGGYSLEFYGSSPWLTYQVFISTTLEANDWTTTDVTLNVPSKTMVTAIATIPDNASKAFMRVEATPELVEGKHGRLKGLSSPLE